jgi:hypothetical protein
MKDFLGNELQIGDYVVVMCQGYREFTVFRIQKFTPKCVKLVRNADWKKTFVQYPYQVIKIDEMQAGYLILSGKIKPVTI